MNKILHCIRHGEALHNVLYKQVGELAYVNHRDTTLTMAGIQQAKHLGYTWKEKKDIELIVVSPLTRTLETASHIFKDSKIPIMAIDDLKEFPQSYQKCNHRRCIEKLSEEFKNINFSEIKENNDIYWKDNPDTKIEEIEKLHSRIEYFKDWVSKRKEKNIAVVGHSSYLNMMLNGFIDDETSELKHCEPYKYYL